MGVYDRFAATALRLIKKYGEECQYSNVTVEPDENSPWLETGVGVTSTQRIAFFPLNEKQSKALQRKLGGTSPIPTGLEQALMARVSFEPGMKDIIARSTGKPYRIVDMDVIKPNAESAVLYIFTVQR